MAFNDGEGEIHDTENRSQPRCSLVASMLALFLRDCQFRAFMCEARLDKVSLGHQVR